MPDLGAPPMGFTVLFWQGGGQGRARGCGQWCIAHRYGAPEADLFPFPFLPATRSAPSSKGGLARL